LVILSDDEFKSCKDGSCNRCDLKGNIKPVQFGAGEYELSIRNERTGIEEPLTKCPMIHVTPFVSEMVGLYSHYRNGLLPDSGGIKNQDNKTIRAFNVLSGIDSAIQRDKMEKRR